MDAHASMVCWGRRWGKMQETIKDMEPDVITFQEFDHMAEAQVALGKIGYLCAMTGQVYSPMHSENLGQGMPEKYIQFLKDSGIAFAPNLPSNCRRFGLKTRDSADNDGCAIFWREATLTAEALEFLPFKEQAKRYS